MDLHAHTQGMLTCGISNDDIAMVFRTISAVLWIGQIGFSPRANDSCTIRDTEPVHIVSGTCVCLVHV